MRGVGIISDLLMPKETQTKRTRYMEELCDSGALIMPLQPSARMMPVFFFRKNMWAQPEEYKEKNIEGLAMVVANVFFLRPKVRR